MFNTIVPIRKSVPFVWTETFPDLPSTGIELSDWLGTDGTVSADLGNTVTHYAILDRNPPWEIGIHRNAHSGSGGIINETAGVAYATDPDFWSSSPFNHPVADIPTINDNIVLPIDTSSLSDYFNVPSVPDGSLSFMFGGVFRIDDDGVAGSANRYLLHSRSTSSPFQGWQLSTDNNNPGRLVIRISWQDASASQLNLDNAWALGVPFVCFGVFDFFNNELRVYSSGIGNGSIVGASTSISVPASTFHEEGRDVTIGSWNFGSNEGIIGQAACFWTQEWSNAIDDGLSEANIEQFLKKSQGYLPLTTAQNLGVQSVNPGSGTSINKCWRNPTTGSPRAQPGIGYRERGTSPNIAALGSGDFTIEYWMFMDSSGSHTHVCSIALTTPIVNASWTAKVDYAGISGTGLAQFRSLIGQGNEISPRPPDDEWHHIAFVRSGGNMQNYYDGVANGSSYAHVGDIQAFSSYPLVLGGVPHNSYDSRRHRLADIRVWSVARTAGEIAANYQTELSGNETGLLAYWPLQDNGLDYGPNGYHVDMLANSEFMTAGNGPT